MLLTKEQIKAIMEQVIATGEEYHFLYDLTEQKGYEDKNLLVFTRGKRKTDKVRYCHVFLTHPYGKKCTPHEQGRLYGLEELDDFAEDIQKWALRGWFEDKETIEWNKATKEKVDAFYYAADIREFETEVEGTLGRPLPKDDYNLRRVVFQSYLDCISTGEDVVLKIKISSYEEGAYCGAHFADYRFCYDLKTESVKVSLYKVEYEDDMHLHPIKETERPRPLFIKYAHHADSFTDCFVAHIQKDFHEPKML